MNNFSRQINLALFAASAALLSGCDVNLGPAQLTMRAERSFDLSDTQGGRVSYQVGEERTWMATPDTKTRELEILDTATRQVVRFKGVKFNQNEQTITIAPRSSGQKTSWGERVGLRAVRTADGANNVEVQKEVFKRQPCVIRQCQIGTTACWDYYYGTWDIERTTTTTRYDVKLDITGEDGIVLATAAGKQADVKVECVNITSCQ